VGNSANVDIEKTAEGQRQNVIRLTLVGETISEFVNTRPVPGLSLAWAQKSGRKQYTLLWAT
jgi:hypothetical protein